MNLAHWLARQAQIDPDRPALFLGRDCVAGYGTFWSDARAVAGWLAAQGVRPGDRVAIYMKNVPDYLTVFYGIWTVGAAVVPINAKLHGREAAFIVANSGASHVFASPELDQALAGIDTSVPIITVPSSAFEMQRRHSPLAEIAARSPDDLAWLFYTSGTTGKPKGVMMTHRMLTSMSL
ncbi:MAG: class I adenylate-forming enzyme family protein, partial [Roseobacter sp.]